MYKDGLYLSHSPDNRILVVIREKNGKALWVRDFATVKAALDVLENDLLSNVNREDIEKKLNMREGYFSANLVAPEDDYSDVGFSKYILQTQDA